LVAIERLQEWSQRRNRELAERCKWYEKNAQRLACDCQEQLKHKGGLYERPKSTALRKVGRASDGYYIGFEFVCDVCGTAWFCGLSATESESHYFWEPADEQVGPIELDSQYYPNEPEDFELY
jgi:hypothetical protein